MACNSGRLSALAAAFACMGAAPDRQAVATLRALAARDLRLAAVAYRLQTAAAPDCPDRTALPGMVVQDASQYRADLRPVAAAALTLGALPAVTGVVAGGPAARAGIRAGDAIASIDGEDIDAIAGRQDGRANGARIATIARRLDDAFARGPAALALVRGDRGWSVMVTGAPACRSIVQLGLGDGRNAGADGRVVTIAQDLMDFARSDDELAFVVGHELAHNILRHPYAGTRADPTMLAEREREADYLGLYLVAWAGYDIGAAGPFLRRAAGSDLFPDATHPAIEDRARALAREVAEIRAERAAGRRPEPDYARFAAGG